MAAPDCIRPVDELLADSASMYAPCNECAAEEPLDKLVPFSRLGVFFDRDAGRCPACGRRHIDYVMGQVLSILISRGLKSGRTPLRDVGSPLIVYGFELFEPPRLGPKSLILLLDDVDKDAAERILAEVPEVKGVLKRTGGPMKSVGIVDVNVKPHTYKLLAGCDMRADIVNSLLGDMAFYRNHSEMHVEFHRNNSAKIKMLERMFLGGELDGRTVVDGLASAGTLGLLAAASGCPAGHPERRLAAGREQHPGQHRGQQKAAGRRAAHDHGHRRAASGQSRAHAGGPGVRRRGDRRISCGLPAAGGRDQRV